VLEAKGETKKLTYEEPPVVIPPASKNATSKPVVTTPTVVKKPRPTGTRTIYRVKRGDTLANIAARMGVNWRDIAEWNQIEPNSALLAGSTLYLYDAKPIAEPKPVERATRPDSYRVQAGDTLTDIANKFNLSLSELAKYNNLPVNYSVRTGQNLWLIPDKMSAASKQAASNYRKPTSQVNTSKYTVRSGDTLLGIADKLNVSAQDIAELNDFNTDYRVQLGQTILVPTTKAQTNYFLAGKSVSHTVQPGESLGSIANDYNISLSELAKANYLKPTAGLIVNQKLVIPQAGAAASTPKAAPTKTTSAKVTSVRDDNDQKQP
jgi:LysM repeat protein